jgi:hypothetical protein
LNYRIIPRKQGLLEMMARPERFERVTFAFGGQVCDLRLHHPYYAAKASIASKQTAAAVSRNTSANTMRAGRR